MAELPLVSVIIPVYNGAAYIGQCIQSVLDQQYESIEVIVVNDGSTDETSEVVAQFGERVTEIHQPNAGVAAALNTGILASTGELIAIQGGDDIWLPGKLDAQVRLLQSDRRIGLCYTGSICVDSELEPIGTAIRPVARPRRALEVVFPGNAIPAGAAVVRRIWFDRVGLHDTTKVVHEDWDLWVRMALAGCRFAAVPDALFLYRVHQTSLSSDPTWMVGANLALLDRYFGGERPQIRDPRLRNLSYRHAHLWASLRYEAAGDDEKALSHLNEALAIPWEGGNPLRVAAGYVHDRLPSGRASRHEILLRLERIKAVRLQAADPETSDRLRRFETFARLLAAPRLLQRNRIQTVRSTVAAVMNDPGVIFDRVALGTVRRAGARVLWRRLRTMLGIR